MSYLSDRKIVYKSSIQRFEFCFAAIGLIFYSGGLTNLLTSAGADSIASLIRYALLAGSLCGMTIDREKTLEAIKRGQWVWPLVLLTIASFAWAANPGVAIQSLRSDFIPVTLFGLYFAIRFSRKEIFQLLYVCTLSMSIVSLFYAIAIPSIGKHPISDVAYADAWRGIFSHKNSLGLNLTINTVLVGISIFYEERKQSLKNWTIYAFLCMEIIFSKSLSALIFVHVILGLIWLYKKFTWKGRITVFILYLLGLLSIGLSVMLNLFWVPTMNALGRDPTLSARTLIWDHIMNQYVAQRPILGFGREALWKSGSFYSGLYEATFHVPPHAHNGYVDLIFDLGYVGLIFFIISFLVVTIKALRLSYKNPKKHDIFPIAVIIILLISNMTESFLIRGSNIMWLLYFTISCSNLERDNNQRV